MPKFSQPEKFRDIKSTHQEVFEVRGVKNGLQVQFLRALNYDIFISSC